MLKQTITKCRRIELPLLDSRCDLRSALGAYGAGSMKWTNLRPKALSLMKQCLDNYSGGQAIIAAHDRWATAPSTQNLPDHAHRVPLALPVDIGAAPLAAGEPEGIVAVCPAIMRWTAAMNTMYHKGYREANPRIGIVCGTVATGGVLYFCADTAYSLHEMVRCEIHAADVADTTDAREDDEPPPDAELTAHISKPLTIRPLSDLFADHYRTVHGDGDAAAEEVILFTCALTWRYTDKRGLFADIRHIMDLMPLRPIAVRKNKKKDPAAKKPHAGGGPDDGEGGGEAEPDVQPEPPPDHFDREAESAVDAGGEFSEELLDGLSDMLLKRQLGECDEDHYDEWLMHDQKVTEESLVKRHDSLRLAEAHLRRKRSVRLAGAAASSSSAAPSSSSSGAAAGGRGSGPRRGGRHGPAGTQV